MGKSAGLGVWKLAGPRTGQERPGGALPSAGHSGVQRWRWSWAPEEHGRSEAHTAWPLPAQGAWSFHFSEGHLHGCQMKSRTSCFRHFVVKKKKEKKHLTSQVSAIYSDHNVLSLNIFRVSLASFKPSISTLWVEGCLLVAWRLRGKSLPSQLTLWVHLPPQWWLRSKLCAMWESYVGVRMWDWIGTGWQKGSCQDLWVAEKIQKRGSPVAWGPGGGLGLFWLRGTTSPLNASHLEA